MKICFKVLNDTKLNNSVKDNCALGLKLSQLKCDSVSFGAMKKHQFQGIDLYVVNKYKAPIDKFNGNDDFQKWCKGKVDEIIETEYQGRREETTAQRKAMLNEWYQYVLNENGAYTDSICLLILDGIVQNLDINSDIIPPVLNKRILADTVDEINSRIKENSKENFNFGKLYQMKLQKQYLKKLKSVKKNSSNNDYTGWIVIPSYNKNPNDFEDNVQKLKVLSHDNWCTKSFNAEPYLKKGNFHIYMEQGKPKIGIRFEGNTILEIQGEKNNSKIPLGYFNLVESYIRDNRYKLSPSVKEELNMSESARREADELESKLKKQGVDFKTATPEQLFEAMGIKVEKNENGKLIIDEYRQPSYIFTFDDIGVNEYKLCKDIIKIKGNAVFEHSILTNLPGLESIEGNADFRFSKLVSIPNLQTIGGNADFRASGLTELSKLQAIGGFADFWGSNITNLPNLESIGGNADFRASKLTDLPKLQIIGGDANFSFSEAINLPGLESIEGNAYIWGSKTTKNMLSGIVKGSIYDEKQ